MKKKLLISLLPALMALGSCAGSASQANGQFFQEDTLLHEEIFGDVSSLLGKVKRNALPEDVDPVEPRIGVQYAENRTGETLNSVSVRYVAAFKVDAEKELSSYTATWTRSAYNVDGSQRFPSGNVNCTKVYASLNEGAGTIEPSDFGDYNYFVVYTLRNIPAAQLGGALCASLTVDDGEGGADPVISKTIATKLDTSSNSVRGSFDSVDFSSTGYFLKGKIGGTPNVMRPADPNLIGLYGNLASFAENFNLAAGDSFVLGYRDFTDPEAPIFKLLNPSFSGETATDAFTKSKGKIVVKDGKANQYGLYLNDANTLSADLMRNVTFRIKADLGGLNMYITGGFNGWSTDRSAYLLTEIDTTNHIYAGTIAIPTGDQNYKFTYNYNKTQFYEEHISNRWFGGTEALTTPLYCFDSEEYYPPLSGKVTLYVTNSQGWSNLYFYGWKDGSNPKQESEGGWPGEKMVFSHKNEKDQDVYKIVDFDLDKFDRAIINNNAGNQTYDIVFGSLGRNAFWIGDYKDGKYEYGVWNYTLTV